MRKWYADHPDYREASKKRAVAYNKTERDKETNRSCRAAWRADGGSERERNCRRIRYALNPLLGRQYAATRRASIRSVGHLGHYTAVDAKLLWLLQDGLCLYCSRPLEDRGHIDHMTPLSRGGSNHPSNICWACVSCNLSKGQRTAEEFSLCAA